MCLLESYPFLAYIGDEHKKDNREKSRWKIENARDIPQGNQNAPEVQAAANDQVPVNPPAMIDFKVRSALSQMAKDITTQDQDTTAQDNREFAPWEDQHVSTAPSCLREFTRMDPPKYFG